jgi:polysaccharide pyruvyl transferase WcaK-like protein
VAQRAGLLVSLLPVRGERILYHYVVNHREPIAEMPDASSHGHKEAGLPAPSVLLMGFYGLGNFGDDLMCDSLARHLMRGGRYQVTIACGNMHAYSHLAALGCRLIPRNLRSVLSAMPQTQVLCQGGGTIFHDSYRGKHLVLYWRNLAKWAALFWMARLKGVQVVIAGAGVGPVRHPVSRWLTRCAFAACTAIGVRDVASVAELKKLKTKTPHKLGFDLAALAAPGGARSNAAARAAAGNSPQEPKVLGVSACSLTPYLGDAALNLRYWQTLGDALASFAQETPVRLIFFSLFTGNSSESDDTATDVIVSRLPPDLACQRHGYQGSVEDYRALFDQCDWFLGTKFHAALAAYLAGCECAIVAYNRKMTDLADEIGLAAERRVAADGVQSEQVWLQVLRSLQQPQTNVLLDAAEARRRAQESVEAVLQAVHARGLAPTEGIYGR